MLLMCKSTKGAIFNNYDVDIDGEWEKSDVFF